LAAAPPWGKRGKRSIWTDPARQGLTHAPCNEMGEGRMSALVPIVPQSPAAIISAAPADQLALLDKAVHACDIAASGSARTAEDLRAVYSPAVANADFSRLMRWLVEHARRPATFVEVAKCIGVLVACYPGNQSDIFVPTACSDVLAENPTAFALEEACRRLRRTSKWLPRISEIIEAIADAEHDLRNNIARLRRVTACLPGIPGEIERREALEKRKFEDDVQAAIRRLEKGSWVADYYSKPVIDEAQRRCGISPETAW
jgi:hypothetical protein